MNVSHKPRICYILPSYDPAAASHFFHNYEFLKYASRGLDIFLLVEKAAVKPEDLGARSYCQKFSWPPLRFIELLVVLMRERLRGRRHFYVHYSFYGAMASWLVTRLAGGEAYYWNCGMPWLYRRPWFEELVFQFILRHTILVTGTLGLSRQYQKNYGLKPECVRILPNWINLARFGNVYDRNHFRARLGIPADAKVVLFVHRLSRRKGAHLIPEIAAAVAKTLKNVMFVIVGDGPERRNLQLTTDNLQLAPFVRLAGEVPQRDLPPYFWAADVLLMPSEEEGFPHVLLEAMASGVSYVASNVGGVREITPPFLLGNLVAPGDVKLFSEKIITLLNKSPEDIAAIGRQEQKWVKRYSINQALADFTALFR